MRLRTFTLALLLTVALTVSSWGQSPFRLSDGGSITVSGDQVRIQNKNGSVIDTFEELIAGAPATVSVTIQGCMRGGTCDAAIDTYTTVANAIRKPSFGTVYDYFLVTATWTGGTNVQVDINATMSLAHSGGGGGGGSLGISGTPTSGQVAVFVNATTVQGVNATGTGNVVLSASPTLTGVPTAPTAATITNNNQLASTAYVQANLAGYLTTATAATTYAPLASPTFTGTVTAPSLTLSGITGLAQCLHVNSSGVVGGTGSDCGSGGGGGASTQLDNLSAVAINSSLIPGAVNTVALGSATLPFTNLFLGTVASQAASFSTSALTANRTITIPNANTILAQPIAAVTHQFLTALSSTTGAFTLAQPACADLSNAAASCATDATNATNISTGTLAKAETLGTTVYTDQVNTFGAFAQTFQAGIKFILTDPSDLTKKAEFSLAGITAGATRTVTIPDAASVTVQPHTAVSNQFLTALGSDGSFTGVQPAFTNISGVATKAQAPGTDVYTDQTNTFGAFLQTFQAGANLDLVDSTDGSKVLQLDLSGITTATTRTLTVPDAATVLPQPVTATSHQFLTALSATTGAFSAAQPAFTDISGVASAAQLPNPSATTLGGVESIAAVSHKFLTSISTSGVPAAAQPASADLSDLGSGSGAAQLSGGLLPLAQGGLAVSAASVAAHSVFGNNTGIAAGGAFVRLACADLSNSAASCSTDTTNATNITSGTLPAAQLPNPSASTLGGVESLAAVSHNFLTSISTSGVPAQAQPAFTDLSGSAACSQLPALLGDATTSAGSCTTTVGKVNGVSYGTSPGTNTLPVVTGSNTVTYEAVPNTALANASVTFNSVTVALGGSGTITLDAIGNPVASKTFTFAATNTLTVAGTAPGSVSGAGTAAGTLLTVSGVTGGATTGSATTAGTGSSLSLAAGVGGSGSGGTNAIGGAGGSFTLTAGNGGASGGTAVNSNGGGFTFTAGSPGTGGSGTAGTLGAFLLTQSVTNAVTSSPQLQLQGEYQNASTPTFATDTWSAQDVIASGTNGAAILTLSHAGSSGTAAVSVPNLINTSTTQFGVVLGGGASAIQTSTAVGASNTVLHGVTGAAPTYSAVVGADMSANTVTGTQLAVVQTRRVCSIPVGADNGSALVNADLGPQGRQCFIPAAATIVEVVVAGDAGTPNVIIGRNRAGTIANIVSSALATASAGGIACSNTGGTTGIDGATTCTNTLQNTGLNAGDYLELVSGTAGGTAKRMSIFIIYTVS